MRSLDPIRRTGAVFSQLKPLSVVLLVLRGGIVPLLTHRASQRHNDAVLFSFTCHTIFSVPVGVAFTSPSYLYDTSHPVGAAFMPPLPTGIP